MAQAEAHHHSVLDIGTMPLGRVYAEALLWLVPSDEQADAVAAELRELVSLMDRTDGFETLLISSLLSQAQMEQLIHRVFDGRVSEVVEGFLVVMARKGRLNLLRGAVAQFHDLLDRRKGRQEVIVTTAIKLDQAQRQEVQQGMEQWLGKAVTLRLKVNENLLGGMVVRVNDRLYDSSIAGQLRKIRDNIAMRTLRPPASRFGSPGQSDTEEGN